MIRAYGMKFNHFLNNLVSNKLNLDLTREPGDCKSYDKLATSLFFFQLLSSFSSWTKEAKKLKFPQTNFHQVSVCLLTQHNCIGNEYKPKVEREAHAGASILLVWLAEAAWFRSWKLSHQCPDIAASFLGSP